MRLIKSNFDIVLTKGDTYELIFDISELTQSELTGAYLTVKDKYNPSGTALISKKLNNGITSLGQGRYKVNILSADTANMLVDGSYMFDIEVKYPTAEVKTIIVGKFIVMQEYTMLADEQ